MKRPHITEPQDGAIEKRPTAETGGSGPLTGVKVLDVGTYAVGPGAAALLGFLGADVIRIENPRGDAFYDIQPTVKGMGASYINSNMQKRSIQLDLKSEEGQGKGRRLATWADILIENRLPGVMEKMGLGYHQVAKLNPRLVYISSPGFGSSGPYAGRPALDSLVQALSGFSSIEGSRGGPPELFRVFAHIDHTSGLAVAQAAVLALIKRSKTGEGERIEVWHFSGGVFLQITRIAEYLATGKEPERTGSADARSAPSQSFLCRDGRYVNLTAADEGCWRSLCQVLDLEKLLEDPRFDTNINRLTHSSELAELIGRRVVEAPCWWWIMLLRREGIPCGPVSAPDEVVNGTNLPPETVAPVMTDWGTLIHATHPWKFSGTPLGEIRGTRLPGADQEEIERLVAGLPG